MAPATEHLAGQLGQVGEEVRPAADPRLVFGDDLAPIAVPADAERVGPLRPGQAPGGTADVDVVDRPLAVDDGGGHAAHQGPTSRQSTVTSTGDRSGRSGP